NRARVKHAGRERCVHGGLFEHRGEMLHRASAAGSDQRNLADLAYLAQLRYIVAPAYAVASHAIEHDFAASAVLDLLDPGEHVTPGLAGAVRITCELKGAVASFSQLAVHTHHHTLRAKPGAQGIDEIRIGECRRIDRNLFRAGVQNFLRIGHRANAAGDTKRNIQHPGDPPHPVAVDRAAFRTRRDVIEHELVRALVAIARRQLENVAHDPVVAEANAFYDLAFADVEAGDDASGKNGRSSSGVIRSSNRALPLTAAVTPICASSARSAA